MKNGLLTVSCLAAGLFCSGSPFAETTRTAPAEGAEVYFISPQDGETLSGPVTVRMGLKGMGVAPAGLEHPNTGHHHLLIDTPMDTLALDQPLPASDQTRHFGGGQTQTTLELDPGRHRLQLLFMDYRHISFDPPLASKVIHVVVE